MQNIIKQKVKMCFVDGIGNSNCFPAFETSSFCSHMFLFHMNSSICLVLAKLIENARIM